MNELREATELPQLHVVCRAVPCMQLPELAVLSLHPALKEVETPAPEGLPGLLTPFTPPEH